MKTALWLIGVFIFGVVVMRLLRLAGVSNDLVRSGLGLVIGLVVFGTIYLILSVRER